MKAQQTGHIEVCEVEYDETVLTLLDIVKHLFRFIDPYQVDGQAHDIGSQYLSGVFVSNAEEFSVVEK
ncbi:MAG: peptide-methionine (S)-S-oxide reductase, partial [Erysipelotrichales bacterium]|nr:peptide-methionine (S)-S-oxide reductase [Erysipelotrichales bacterium]